MLDRGSRKVGETDSYSGSPACGHVYQVTPGALGLTVRIKNLKRIDVQVHRVIHVSRIHVLPILNAIHTSDCVDAIGFELPAVRVPLNRAH